MGYFTSCLCALCAFSVDCFLVLAVVLNQQDPVYMILKLFDPNFSHKCMLIMVARGIFNTYWGNFMLHNLQKCLLFPNTRLVEGIYTVDNMDTVIEEVSSQNEQYVAGNLKLHKVIRVVSEIETQLNFYYTSEVNEPFSMKSFDVGRQSFTVDYHVLVMYH